MTDIAPERFPMSMREIVEAIGQDATLTLARAFGGSKVWIPVADKLAEVHPVAQLLGFDVALKLSVVVGGTRLNVPLCQSVNDVLMDADLLRRWRDGDSAREIARAHNSTERTVMRRLARLRMQAK